MTFDTDADARPLDPVQEPEADGLLEPRRELPARVAGDPRPTVQEVTRELQVRADPARVVPDARVSLPWSESTRVRARARDAAHEARLDIFRDDLRAIRIANEVLNRAATMRAVEAAETAIFEIRTLGEAVRLAILNRTQMDMTRQFIQQIDKIDGFLGSVSPEIVDALKERALSEFTDRMNRASKADVEFSRAEILRLKP